MSQVTEKEISDLVDSFYARARAHPQLGPLFNGAIADWPDHLRVIRDFWSGALLGTERYKRHAYPAHVNLPIRLEHFDQWLELFREAARETLPEEAAVRAIARAEHMTESFRRGLFPFEPIRKR
ncbi:MAG: group III truncated hemoglobin [Gammaproteobacteria bacterium]